MAGQEVSTDDLFAFRVAYLDFLGLGFLEMMLSGHRIRMEQEP